MKKTTTPNYLNVETELGHSRGLLYGSHRLGAPDTGVMTRLLIMCALPQATQGDEFYFERRNGPVRFNLARLSDRGLPYGIWPRLLFAWICDEVARTRSPRIVLGRSLNQFLRAVGVRGSYRDGCWDARTGLVDQIHRLIRCAIRFEYADKYVQHTRAYAIAELRDLRWERNAPEGLLWTSWIEVAQGLFREIMSRPVTLDLNVLAAAVHSLLRLDLFLLLSYLTHDLTEPVQVTWKEISWHFRSDAHDTTTAAGGHLRTAVSRELRALKTVWPAFDYEVSDSGLEVRPPLR